MTVAIDEDDLRRKLNLQVRAVQRSSSLPLSGTSMVATGPCSLALRSCGLSHGASCGAIQDI
jgi:hypothetical protein